MSLTEFLLSLQLKKFPTGPGCRSSASPELVPSDTRITGSDTRISDEVSICLDEKNMLETFNNHIQGLNYKDISDRQKFIEKININKTIDKEARKQFNLMNTEFIKQFIQKGFSSGEGIRYMFCLIPYNENLILDYYIQASKKIFYYSTKLNIEVIFCIVTQNKELLTTEKYNQLKDFLSSEIVLEKTFDIGKESGNQDIEFDILKYIIFCSMFDSYILTYDNLIYLSWYLNSNWDTCKIVAPSSIKDKFPENESNSFLDV